MIVDIALLRVACPTCPLIKRQKFIDALNKYLPPVISEDRTVAAFLAQTGHESLDFVFLRELWGPTKAQTRYEGRATLGNTQTGDGSKFRGRGLIQITGRANYSKMADLMGLPLLETPELLSEPANAVHSAVLWWEEHRCSEVFNTKGFPALTRRINGGLNGLADRIVRYDRICRYLNI